MGLCEWSFLGGTVGGLCRWSSVKSSTILTFLPLYQLYCQWSVWLSVVSVFHNLNPNEQPKASEQKRTCKLNCNTGGSELLNASLIPRP